MRVGFGFDCHRFGQDRPLRLGGVTVPGAPGLVAHSDGDCVLHAIADALLGAAGLPDLGEQFPDTDPRWKDADSGALLRLVAGRVAAAGFRVGNVDVTLLAERPRIAPHREAMRARIAELLGVPVAGVGVKATTLERMGALGRGEGVACQAVCLVTEA
ncbi:MAG: 2-C-methyl-D-erythritol 2,4-cyclodiphosphate synthase [Planctomycetota bacterium]